jgi:hypothetical protein
MSADLKDYRAARRAFIAACEQAGVDTIARVHPVKGADGKPLFMDSAALGPRLAGKALIAIAQDLPGSQALTALLHKPVVLPEDMRLVLVHALMPADTDAKDWLRASLQAVATEDLSRVRELAVLALGEDGKNFEIHPPQPDAIIRVLPSVATGAKAHDAIAMFLAAKSE